MKREKNLFPRVVDFANLYRAFIGASHGKRERSEVREFEYHLETRLWEIRDELEAGAYAWGPFHCFWVNDPKRREIRAAPFRDRVVHHALFDVIDPIFRRGFIADSYERTVAGRGNLARAARATQPGLECAAAGEPDAAGRRAGGDMYADHGSERDLHM